MDLRSFIRDVPDFPRPGILFRDITPLLANSEAFRATIEQLAEIAAEARPECIVGVESRGFIFGAPLADRLSLPFVPVRKAGKLPAARMSVEYSLEYGESQLDIHQDAIPLGASVLVVDDLLATGGTSLAATKLVEMTGGVVRALLFVVELEALRGRDILRGYPVHSLVIYT